MPSYARSPAKPNQANSDLSHCQVNHASGSYLVNSNYRLKNVMELLVEQEVARQIQLLPEQKGCNLKPVQVITYAMNRLTPLYACTEQGLTEQLKKARKEHGIQVKQIVRSGINAVLQDPLREFKPFQVDAKQQQALVALRALLKDESIDLNNLPREIQSALEHASDACVDDRYCPKVNRKVPNCHDYQTQTQHYQTQHYPAQTQNHQTQNYHTSESKRTVDWQTYKRNRQLTQNNAVTSGPESTYTSDVDRKKGLTWQDYKRQRAAKLADEHLNRRSTSGAAGRLRLFS